MLELVINNEYILEVAQESIKYTLQNNDIADLESRQCSFTNSFSVPKTFNNVNYFKQLGVVGDISDIPYKKVTAMLLENGIPLITSGWLEVKETTNEYKIHIRDGSIDLFKAIENKTFGDDVDLSEIDHSKDLNTIINSFTNENYRYIINDYGGKTHTDNGTKINADYLVPSVRVKYLWDKIFTTFGFNYFGGVFNSRDFEGLWINYPKGISLDNETIQEYAILTRTTTQDFRITAFLSWENINVNNGNLISNWRYEVPETGKYRIDSLINYTPTISNTNPLYQIRINNNSVGSFVRNVDNSLNITLNAGSIIEIYFDNSLVFFEQSYLKIYKYDDKFNFTDELKQLKITDFFKEILWRFALTIFIDIDGNYIFKTFDERLQADVIDWSEKYKERTSETYVPKSYAQKNIFKENYQKENYSYNDGNLELKNNNLKEINTVINSKFYTYDNDLSIFFINSSKNENIFRTALWDKEISENQNLTKINYKSISNRFYFLRSEIISENAIIKSETLNAEQNVSSLPIARFFMTSFKDFVSKYYNNYKILLEDFRMHKISLALNNLDIHNLDFDKIYYFEQEQNYYILNKLTYESCKLSNSEFYRVKYTEANYCIGFKANDDIAFVNIGETIIINVLENDNYPIGTLSIEIINQPINGTAIVNANNTITYTHNGSEILNDTFTYVLSNGLCVSTAVVEIKEFVSCVNLISINAEDNFETPIQYQYILCDNEDVIQDYFIGSTGDLNICIKEGSLLILSNDSVTINTGFC